MGKHLYWIIFLINMQAYKPATLLQGDSNIVVSCEYCEVFKNIYSKRHLWTIASELYWFKLEVIIEKTETYSETIIGEVFRTQWNI